MAPQSFGDSAAAKDELRAQIRAARAGRPTCGTLIAAQASGITAGHDVVAIYGASGDEPDTWPLIEQLHTDGVTVLLPVLKGRHTPDWALYTGRDGLREGWHGILEPTSDALGADALSRASLVITSALAVARDGYRLGVGGGWYDRALAHADPASVLVALCYDAEIVDAVPTDPWDQRVDAILTEARLLPVTE